MGNRAFSRGGARRRRQHARFLECVRIAGHMTDVMGRGRCARANCAARAPNLPLLKIKRLWSRRDPSLIVGQMDARR